MICSRPECTKIAKSKGFCHNHWSQNWRQNNLEKSKQIAKNHRLKYRDQYILREKVPERRYVKAKAKAKPRGLSFNLTFEEYNFLINQPCNYCQGVFGKVETSVGLDRIDNNKGYDSGNVLPCCTFCNRTRGDRFTVYETKQIIEFVLKMRNYA